MVKIQLKTEVNTYLFLHDDFRKIRNEQIFIIAKAGWGKGLTGEGIAEEFHKAGYIILVIADPKDELEWAYAMFEPKEYYHLVELKKEGKKPDKKKVKIYHPFTFSIPRTNLPEINFFTFSIKDLGRREWGILAETDWDTDTIRLLVNTSQNLSNDDGIYSFLHNIQDSIIGKRDRRRVVPDPKNFYLSATAGTLKSMQDISNYILPFKKDYFLSKENSSLKLNWKDILSDRENYHVFVSNFIRDPKLKEFVVLTLLNQIINNKDLAKYPLCIIIPEVRKLVPFKPQGYKLFLSEAIKEGLSTMRSMGRGMSSIIDSQVFKGVDEDVRNSATTMLIGEMGGASDIEALAKAMNYKRDVREQLAKMEYPNSFLMSGREDVGAIKMWFPSHCHCEPEYNFFEIYRREYPEKMKKYADLLDSMLNISKSEEEKIREKVKRRIKEEREAREMERKEKERQEGKQEKVEEKIDKAKEIERKSKMQLMKLCYEMKQKFPDLSYRQIGKEFGINHITAKKYIQDFEKSLEEGNNKNYEEKALEEINSKQV